MPFFMDATRALYKSATMMTMLAIACGFGMLASAERRGRLTIAAAHGQLMAMQQLLGDTVRASERLRIARDLHDAIGHHLTALSLHLDLATRQQETPSDALTTARSLTRSLMAEIRAVVDTERGSQLIDLRRALEALCTAIPAPRIELHCDDVLAIQSPALAQELFYVIQEGLTNAVRHAQASYIVIDVEQDSSALIATITDDGRGKPAGVEGNGLRGLRERLTALGGHFEERAPSDGGHRLHIVLPAKVTA
jgi:two-component system, NarL family, sensor histidine kinase DesK